jgi:hypothetical protein
MNFDKFEGQERRLLSTVNKYFLRETGGNQREADEMMGKLATVLQEPGAKLVDINNIVFLILVRGKGAVEVHTMAADLIPANMVAGFKKLAEYLKSIGVTLAYTYTEDRRFARIARQTRLPIKELKEEMDGKTIYIYVVEF